jgi:hypothetical protein
MTETRSMQESDRRAASNAEQVAHQRTAVERWLVWSGLVPLPVFLCLHVARELGLAFESDVTRVLRPERGALALISSVLLVWLPLGVHAALAAWLAASGRKLPPLPDDVPRLARAVSRVSAVGALGFVLYHAVELPLPVLRGRAAAEDSGFRLIALLSSTAAGVPLAGALHLLGLLATTTHAGLSLHRGLLGEGWLNDGERRRRSARLCAAGAVLTFLLGAAAVIRVASGALLR